MIKQFVVIPIDLLKSVSVRLAFFLSSAAHSPQIIRVVRATMSLEGPLGQTDLNQWSLWMLESLLY